MRIFKILHSPLPNADALSRVTVYRWNPMGMKRDKKPLENLMKKLNQLLGVALMLCSLNFARAAPLVPLAEQTPPTLQVPHVETPPRLGADEAIWAKGALISSLGLAQGEASAGLKPVPTQVRLLWSKTGLYVSFRCQDNAVFTPEKGRDAPIWKGDVVEVFLDVKGDARQWIELEVSPNGDLFDQMATLTATPQSNENRVLKDEVLSRDWWTDLSWNLENWQVNARKNLPVQTTQTSNSLNAWRVDMRIPPDALRRLGVSEFKPMTMRLNLIRYKYLPTGDTKNPRRLLAMNWAPVMFGCPHISPEAMGFVQLMPPVTAATKPTTNTISP